MVASVNDKFINVSAHTSYLYLVKERISKTTFRDQSRTTKPQLNPLGSPRRMIQILRISTRCWAGRPLYYEVKNPVNIKPGTC